MMSAFSPHDVAASRCLPGASSSLTPRPTIWDRRAHRPHRRHLWQPSKALVLRIRGVGGQGQEYHDEEEVEVPSPFELAQRIDKQKPLVRVDLQAGQRIEYKYVILEEQDWTKLENEDSQGLVEITYRTGNEPGKPPDVQVIQKQMAIVAWQPGPNRILQVPNEAELQELQLGQAIERIPARPGQRIPYENTTKRPPPLKPDPFEGTWEVLTVDEAGEPFLDRHDSWAWIGRTTPSSSLPKGFSFQ